MVVRQRYQKLLKYLRNAKELVCYANELGRFYIFKFPIITIFVFRERPSADVVVLFFDNSKERYIKKIIYDNPYPIRICKNILKEIKYENYRIKKQRGDGDREDFLWDYDQYLR